MLSEMLLQTKMSLPPQRPFLILRPQLNKKLTQAISVPLTLVSAPAGFGKTTLVASALKAEGKKQKAEVAWLSLDKQDNETSRFWQYFFVAISPASPFAEQLTQPQSPPIQVLLTGLINQLAQQTNPLLLVLDDLHLLENSDIYQNLAFLLENAPHALHLIFVTRADPPLPLHRFRARGQLLEIRADDLRFSPNEAANFLQQATTQTLANEDIALLAEQTEGWAVGLQLAALALPDHTAEHHQFIQRLSSSNRYILEYLTEEVLAQQPEPVQSFLLQTAVLDELCADLCDAVVGINQSQEILTYLNRHNLFTTILQTEEIGETWYRYHHLFAALLLGHLRQEQPEQEATLHQRSAQWFAQHGDIETAVSHAFAANDDTLAATLIEENASLMVMQGRARLVESWLNQLPKEQHQTMPRANLAFAQALLLRGQLVEAAQYLNRAKIGNQVNPSKTIQGQIQALQSVLADTHGDHETAHALAQQTIQHAPPDDAISQAMAHFALAGAAREAGDAETASALYDQTIPLCRAAHLLLLEILARAHLGFLCHLRGQLHRAKATAAPIGEAHMQHPAAAAIYTVLVSVYLEWHQLEEAETWLKKALAMEKKGGHNAAAVHAYILNSRLQRAKNETAAAQQALIEAASLFEAGAPVWQEALLRHAQVCFWLSQNDPNAAAHYLALASTPPPHMQDFLHLAQARIDLHIGTPISLAAAQKVLENVVETAVSQQRHGIVIEAKLLLALVQSAQHNQQAALSHLQTALSLAEPEGYTLLFMEMGKPMRTLLTTSHIRYANHLLQAFSHSSIVKVAGQRFARKSEFTEPLTARETEVLHLMARGLTYQQIADELVVSVNTVRHHVKGLYSKLGVNSRAQAVAKAQPFGIND